MMTVFAQDPLVEDPGDRPLLVKVPVPADRLQRGPRNHRFHVVDLAVGSYRAAEPVQLHSEDPYIYVDRWADESGTAAQALAGCREFRAQHIFAVAAHTLALFERHLGRPIPWRSGYPQLFLVPAARLELNAFYSPEHSAVFFGWFPGSNGQPDFYAALSYDLVAHEISHAVLDGLRPRYIEPGLPEQRAVHEAIADLVALLSVFELEGAVEHLLDPRPDGTGRVDFGSGSIAPDDVEAIDAARAEWLLKNPLTRLAEQLGSRTQPETVRPEPTPALRSIRVPEDDTWKKLKEFEKPYRRAEVLVGAVMRTLIRMWVVRLHPLAINDGGIDVARAAEEGIKAARHLLAMLLRSLDYLPPIEPSFADVLDSVITADARLVPDDKHDYRGALLETFRRFGIRPPRHQILDEDGSVAPSRDELERRGVTDDLAHYEPDPDAPAGMALRYDNLNLVALRTSPEEVYQFIWTNATTLQIDVRFATRVERVLSTTRVGPDGLVVNEIIADYIQRLHTTAGRLPPGIRMPRGMPTDTPITMWGGGVLVFDQFGRFRLHQRQPLLDIERQSARLRFLHTAEVVDDDGGFGASNGEPDRRYFAAVHEARIGAQD